jgi:hypothetical protein
MDQEHGICYNFRRREDPGPGPTTYYGQKEQGNLESRLFR